MAGVGSSAELPAGVAVCTTVPRRHLPRARVIAESVRDFHPDLPVKVLVSDWQAGIDEDFEVFGPAALKLTDLAARRFGYEALELSYALTPAFLRHLLRGGYSRLLFVKQESLVVGELSPLFDELDDREILLTPHLAGRRGVSRERELNILQSGAYNAGVVGIASGNEARRFLDWWDARATRHCRHAIGEGMHFEQRWLELAPSLFASVRIAKDPGYNIGHWCLPECELTIGDGRVLVDGRPVQIVRFSGFDVDEPEYATTHSRRVRVADLGDGAEIFERYRQAIVNARGRTGGDGAQLDTDSEFDNGVPIPAAARSLHLGLGDDESRFGDPFDSRGEGSFYNWLNEPVDAARPVITRLWDYIYGLRQDVQRAYPDHRGAGRAGFVAWTTRSGLREHGIDRAFAPDEY